MYNDFPDQKRTNEIRGLTRTNDREIGFVEISSDGTKIAHGLKTMPKWVQCIPYKHRGVVPMSWWYYQKPDATYLYIQASATGRFLVTVGG
jgi:hypothetical protein